MKTAKEILIEAKALIATEAKWTQGSFAKNETGDDCSVFDEEACKFCVLGAIDRVSLNDNGTYTSLMASAAVQLLQQVLPYNIVRTNDGDNGFQNIHKALDQAIVLASKEQP